MKVGDLVQHKTYGHIGLILQIDPRKAATKNTACAIGDHCLVVWSNWPNLPQANNHTWALSYDIEIINESR